MHWSRCYCSELIVHIEVRTDLFLSSDYWDNVSSTEYDGYSRRPYNPNKDKSWLDKTKTVTHFPTMTSILLLLIDEYILVHKQRYNNNHESDLTNGNLVTYCWRFLSKRDEKAHAYFKDKFSNKKQKGIKQLSIIIITIIIRRRIQSWKRRERNVLYMLCKGDKEGLV